MKTNTFALRAGLLALTGAALFSACKKDEPAAPVTQQPNNPASTSTYIPITDGSYWIYQEESTDSLGTVTNVYSVDSTFVAGDTTIGANTYKRIITTTLSGSSMYFFTTELYLRDSSGYIVDRNGDYIPFANHTDTLRTVTIPVDTNYTLTEYFFMRHIDSTVTVPAGTFQTVNYRSDNYYDDPAYNHPNPRHSHRIFAENVGEIVQIKYFLSQAGYVQKRLLRYHIQ